MGCGEIIEQSEEEYFLNLRGIDLLRFHDVCYSARATFKARSSGKAETVSGRRLVLIIVSAAILLLVAARVLSVW